MAKAYEALRAKLPATSRKRAGLQTRALLADIRRHRKSAQATMQRQRFETIWGALSDTPAESASMAMRSELLIAIEQRVRGWKVTKAEAARRLGITQPRLNDLLRGKIANFSLDSLINLASQAGLKVTLAVKPDIHRAA